MPPPKRILVRGVNWLGDAVMSTPALLRLREAFPNAEITLATLEKLAPLFLAHPAVNHILSLSSHEGLFTRSRRLNEVHAEVGLLLPNSFRSAAELFLAGVPRRVGYARQLRKLLVTDPVEERSGRVLMHKRSDEEIRQRIKGSSGRERFSTAAHQLHEYLHLASALGANPALIAPRLHLSASEKTAACEKFGVAQGPWIGLNPGAEYGPAKRWPKERFIATALGLSKRLPASFLLTGSSADIELAGQIEAELKQHGINVLNLAGKTSLRELCAVLSSCSVLLTNDTGPMHLASALGTRVVVPFGSTSHDLTGPGLPGTTDHACLFAEVPCAPCFRKECPIDFRCMNSISIEAAIQAVTLMNQPATGAFH
ncbi:MAG: glycosyltransferase family 9 protein [Verrucomicrobiota bacterium]|nr:glycosyltransferase family 9 protein [Verrucomicrobiota bacterium]